MIVGVLAGLVAAAAGWTGAAFKLAEAVTVVVAAPAILFYVDRSGHGHDDRTDPRQHSASL